MNNSQETIHKLESFDYGNTQAERLAASVLILRGYVGVDPSHPRGGPDGVKDIICYKERVKFVCGVYFSKKKKLSEVKKKFSDDILGVKKNDAKGFIFITNIELTLSEREGLKKGFGFTIDIVHLETLASHLNSPEGYAIRLDYLGILMGKEEQVAFFQSVQNKQMELITLLKQVLDGNNNSESSDEVETVYAFNLKREGTFSFSQTPGMFGASNHEIFKKCSKCGYGYSYVDLYDGQGYLSGSAMFISQNPLNAFEKEKVVQCPSCKNIEQV